MASKNKKVTTDDFAFDDENEASSFSMILNKSQVDLRTNPGQFSDKLRTSDLAPELTSDKPKTQPRTDLRTNPGQFSDKLRTSDLAPELTSDKPKTQPRTDLRTNPGQSSDKLRTIFGFHELSGLQKEITLLIYDMCLIKGDRSTGAVSVEHIFLRLNSTRLSVQKSIQRLEQKNILIRKQFRSGRGGWTVYALPDAVWNQILQMESSDKLRTNLGQTSDKPKTEPKTEPRTSPPSSSSRDLLIKESTTTQSSPENSDWMSRIDLRPVQASGITRSVLARCLELYPNLASQPEALEQLVFRFGEYLKMPQTKIKNARGFFIGLSEQLSKGQTPLDHIETPEEQLLKELVEKQDLAKARRAELEAKALDFECETWLEQLPHEQRLELAPENHVVKFKSPAQDRLLKEHFRLAIWPVRRSEILEGLKHK